MEASSLCAVFCKTKYLMKSLKHHSQKGGQAAVLKSLALKYKLVVVFHIVSLDSLDKVKKDV
jgi:hypothetical protein